ncbi:MAG: peptidylprolyl isomerase [SAR86 cluster bacterium]|uniref:Peptidyl-prolyl cis-trans isomerase n=1 Tax=SAR86 cluster bacterium TaxID=2030880 RepID=A0A2A5BAM1_9GAMM|nr:MAG: peptidylprolyl isomerase [SAR86 cluster bacterium]
MNALIRKSKLLIALTGLLVTSPGFAQGDVDLENEDDQIAYSIGVNIGTSLVNQQILEGIELDTFVVGMLDAINSDLKMTEEEMFAAIQTFQQRMADAQQAELQGNIDASMEYLSLNADKEGVVVLDSGLQYLILETGPVGGTSPELSDSVLAHYHGTLTDGSVFDSSVDRGEPAQFGVSQVISGWTEALQLMTVGDKWRLFIPPGMAYGEASPTPAIPPNSALIFDVELLEIR